MISKTKKISILTTALAGTLVATSVGAIALSACSTNATPSTPENPNYEFEGNAFATSINWNDSEAVSKLITDDQGLVFSSETKEEVIALNPKSELTTIVIPATVRAITGFKDTTPASSQKEGDTTVVATNKGAFEGSKVTNVTFAGNPYIIGPQAFKKAASLESITLPKSLNIIDNSAFEECAKLDLSKLDLSNIKVIGHSAFKGAFVTPKSEESTSRENDLDTSTTTLKLTKIINIGNSAFEKAQINQISFEGNTQLRHIGERAFMESTLSGSLDLTKLTNLTEIENLTFALTSKLESIILPSSITTLGMNVFNSTKAKTIDLGQTSIKTITNGTFFDAASVNNITLPSTATILESHSFQGTSALKSLTLPASLQVIEMNTFNAEYVQNSITKAKITQSVAPSGLTSLDLSKTKVSTLPIGMFIGCSDLESVTLHSNTTSIPNYAFTDSGITKLQLPTKIDSIGDYAFANADALEAMSIVANDLTTGTGTSAKPSGKLVLPASIKSLGTTAFANTKFTTIDLSKMSSVTTVPTGTFENTPTLTSVQLSPETVTISTNAFTTNSTLKTVNFDKLTKLETIDSNNFNGANFATLDLSKTIISEVKENTFKDMVNSSLNTITLPITVSSIANDSLTKKQGETTSNINLEYKNESGQLALPNNAAQGAETDTSSLNKLGFNRIPNVDLTSMSHLTTISGGTFTGSTVLETLTLPAKATIFEMTTANKLDTAAFNNNNSLNQIEYQKFGTDNAEIVLTKDSWNNDIQNNTQLWNTIVALMNSVGHKTDLTNSEIIQETLLTWSASSFSTIETDLTKDSIYKPDGSTDTEKNKWFNGQSTDGAITPPSDWTAANNEIKLVTQTDNSNLVEQKLITLYFKHNGVIWKWTQNQVENNKIEITLETDDSTLPNFYKTTLVNSTNKNNPTYNIGLFGTKSTNEKESTTKSSSVKITLNITSSIS